MGIFSRKKSTPATATAGAARAATTSAAQARDIPTLYPTFYSEALKAAGKPVTEHNVDSVAMLTSKNLALNAGQWLKAVGDTAAQVRWEAEFNPAANATRSPQARLADDMIDFLWAWTPRVHPGLRDFVGQMPDTIAGSVAPHGDVLPEDLWGH